MLCGNPYDANCPTRRILDRIGDRWTVLIIGALGDGLRIIVPQTITA